MCNHYLGIGRVDSEQTRFLNGATSALFEKKRPMIAAIIRYINSVEVSRLSRRRGWAAGPRNFAEATVKNVWILGVNSSHL